MKLETSRERLPALTSPLPGERSFPLLAAPLAPNFYTTTAHHLSIGICLLLCRSPKHSPVFPVLELPVQGIMLCLEPLELLSCSDNVDRTQFPTASSCSFHSSLRILLTWWRLPLMKAGGSRGRPQQCRVQHVHEVLCPSQEVVPPQPLPR